MLQTYLIYIHASIIQHILYTYTYVQDDRDERDEREERDERDERDDIGARDERDEREMRNETRETIPILCWSVTWRASCSVKGRSCRMIRRTPPPREWAREGGVQRG